MADDWANKRHKKKIGQSASPLRGRVNDRERKSRRKPFLEELDLKSGEGRGLCAHAIARLKSGQSFNNLSIPLRESLNLQREAWSTLAIGGQKLLI